MVMSLLRWGIILGVIGWLGSVTVAAVAEYLELNDVIEHVVVDARPAAGGTDVPDPADLKRFQDHVVQRASRPDAPLPAEAVLVTASPGSLRVSVRWSQPVLAWNGRTLWAVPLSLSRSFSNTQ